MRPRRTTGSYQGPLEASTRGHTGGRIHTLLDSVCGFRIYRCFDFVCCRWIRCRRSRSPSHRRGQEQQGAEVDEKPERGWEQQRTKDDGGPPLTCDFETETERIVVDKLFILRWTSFHQITCMKIRIGRHLCESFDLVFCKMKYEDNNEFVWWQCHEDEFAQL